MNALDGGSGRDRYAVVFRKPRFGLPMVPTVRRASSTPGDFRCLEAPPPIHLSRLHGRGAHQTAQDSCPLRRGPGAERLARRVGNESGQARTEDSG